jgi:hypothetical protein
MNRLEPVERVARSDQYNGFKSVQLKSFKKLAA